MRIGIVRSHEGVFQDVGKIREVMDARSAPCCGMFCVAGRDRDRRSPAWSDTKSRNDRSSQRLCSGECGTRIRPKQPIPLSIWIRLYVQPLLGSLSGQSVGALLWGSVLRILFSSWIRDRCGGMAEGLIIRRRRLPVGAIVWWRGQQFPWRTLIDDVL